MKRIYLLIPEVLEQGGALEARILPVHPSMDLKGQTCEACLGQFVIPGELVEHPESHRVLPDGRTQPLRMHADCFELWLMSEGADYIISDDADTDTGDPFLI